MRWTGSVAGMIAAACATTIAMCPTRATSPTEPSMCEAPDHSLFAALEGARAPPPPRAVLCGRPPASPSRREESVDDEAAEARQRSNLDGENVLGPFLRDPPRAEEAGAGGESGARRLLDPEAAMTEGDRRHGYRLAFREIRAADRLHGTAQIAVLDRARRRLTHALFLPEMFYGVGGSPTMERDSIAATIEGLNARVLTTPNVPGLTTTHEVAPGETAWALVQPRAYGPNALLFWNHAGDLDARRLRARETLTVPLESVSLRVDRVHRRLTILLGGVFVREFPASVAADESLPIGDWAVSWDALDLTNRRGWESAAHGSAWIPLWCDGRGPHLVIRGTNAPETVGSVSSPPGRVVLRNEDATETLWWVAKCGGQRPHAVIR